MVDTQQRAQKRLDELDELRKESERIIAESKNLVAQMEERLEKLRQQQLANDALREQAEKLKNKT
jgi:hypothetical protein